MVMHYRVKCPIQDLCFVVILGHFFILNQELEKKGTVALVKD